MRTNERSQSDLNGDRWPLAKVNSRWLDVLRLGFSTKLCLHCPGLHFTRVCGFCHHPSLSNSGNVSGHHLADSNKNGCLSSFVSFVASFLSVHFCHHCQFSPFFLILSQVVSYDVDLKLSYAFESIPRLLQAYRPPCILHRFYKMSPYLMCVYCSARAKWHPFRCT